MSRYPFRFTGEPMTTVERPFEDYRNAHHGKGTAYHRGFSDNVYRSTMWEIEQGILLDYLRTYFDRPADVRLLDFACGTGRVLDLLEDEVASATGVDVTASMLDVASEVTSKSRLINCDITRSGELDDDRFDMITAFRFFPNAEPPLRNEAMAKLSMMLAPGGILVFNNHIRTGSSRHRARLQMAKRGKLKSKNDLHCMSDAEAMQLAQAHGLTIVEERHAGVLPILREKKPGLLKPFLRPIEKMAARVKPLSNLAAYKVYVAQRDSREDPSAV